MLVTSHSPDLLDNQDIAPESLLAVDNHDGVTRIRPVDQAAKSVLIKKLFTPGELLRLGQLSALSSEDEPRQHDMLATEG